MAHDKKIENNLKDYTKQLEYVCGWPSFESMWWIIVKMFWTSDKNPFVYIQISI